MAGLFDVGKIAAPGADFASTGPHLHFSVYDPSGKAIDPETAKSFLLNRLLVGQNKTPLASQGPSGWVENFTVTSPFGHREAPTPGATTEHQGTDIGIPQGTQLSWLANPGDVYNSDKGFGTIRTTDPQGRPYTVKLLHTTPGSVAQAPGQAQQPQQPGSAATGNVYNIYFGGKGTGDTSPASSFLSNYMFGMTSPQLAARNPLGDIAQVLFQTPNYLS